MVDGLTLMKPGGGGGIDGGLVKGGRQRGGQREIAGDGAGVPGDVGFLGGRGVDERDCGGCGSGGAHSEGIRRSSAGTYGGSVAGSSGIVCSVGFQMKSLIFVVLVMVRRLVG